MPTFTYTAVAEDGTVVSGKAKADDLAAAHARLGERALQPLTVKPKSSLLQVEITKKKAKRKDLMHLCRQLAVFLRAGIPVLDALTVLAEETSDKLVKAALDDMAEALRAGQTFSVAASAHPELWPTLCLEMLHSAELTGDLDGVLAQLAEYLEREIEARRKVISALTYPLIVVGLSVVTVVILAGFVLPKFRTFFDSLDAELPLPTRMLLAVSAFVTDWAPIAGPALLILVIVLAVAARRPKGRAVRDRLVLKLPLVGNLLRVAILERFCRVLASMTRAGVSLPEALAVSGTATSNHVFRSGISDAREAMMRGEGLATPLAATGLFPAAARQMLRVGEDTGTLDQQLETAAEYFDKELDYKIGQLTTILEPAVILFVGGVVGFVAVALVSAMYGVFNQVG